MTHQFLPECSPQFLLVIAWPVHNLATRGLTGDTNKNDSAIRHPNIGAIYGLEHTGGVRFLVLELVEGSTLAERLKSGPLDIAESMRIAVGIAEALEAAHEKGVVH